jgi:hypothetical protein
MLGTSYNLVLGELLSCAAFDMFGEGCTDSPKEFHEQVVSISKLLRYFLCYVRSVPCITRWVIDQYRLRAWRQVCSSDNGLHVESKQRLLLSQFDLAALGKQAVFDRAFGRGAGFHLFDSSDDYRKHSQNKASYLDPGHRRASGAVHEAFDDGERNNWAGVAAIIR